MAAPHGRDPRNAASRRECACVGLGSGFAPGAPSTVTPALFAPWTNTVFPLAVAAGAVSGIGALVGLMVYVRTPRNTGQLAAVDQPVSFDHRHHTRDDGVECLYCHSNAERSPSAGIPSTETCMGCHSQVWNDSILLEPVRRSYFSGQPLPWNRVHDLPDFVYFDHSAHLRGGLECATCHGDVETMASVVQVAPLTMIWCLDCHRDPEARGLSPTDVAGKVTRLTTCTTCHR